MQPNYEVTKRGLADIYLSNMLNMNYLSCRSVFLMGEHHDNSGTVRLRLHGEVVYVAAGRPALHYAVVEMYLMNKTECIR